MKAWFSRCCIFTPRCQGRSEQRRHAAGAQGTAAMPGLDNAWAAGASLGAGLPGSGSGALGSFGSSLFGSGGAGACGGSGSSLMGGTAPAGMQPMDCNASMGGSSLYVGSGGLVNGALGGALGGWGAGAPAGSGSGAFGVGGWGGSLCCGGPAAKGVAGALGSMDALGGPVGCLQRAGGSMGSGALAGLALLSAAPDTGGWLGPGLQGAGGSLGSGALTADAGGLGAWFAQGADAGCLGRSAGSLQHAGGSWGSGSLAALVALAAASPRRDPELRMEGLVTARPCGAQRTLAPTPRQSSCADAGGKRSAPAPSGFDGVPLMSREGLPGGALAGYEALEARLAGLASAGSGLCGMPWWPQAAALSGKGPGRSLGGAGSAAAPREPGPFLNPPTAGQVCCAVACSSATPFRELAHARGSLAPAATAASSADGFEGRKRLAGALCRARKCCTKVPSEEGLDRTEQATQASPMDSLLPLAERKVTGRLALTCATRACSWRSWTRRWRRSTPCCRRRQQGLAQPRSQPARSGVRNRELAWPCRLSCALLL